MKVIQYLRDEKNSKQQQILSKNLGTSLGFLIGKIPLIRECPTALISKHFPLSPFGSLHLLNYEDNPCFNIYCANETFSFLNDKMLFILLLLTFFMTITAITLILCPR